MPSKKKKNKGMKGQLPATADNVDVYTTEIANSIMYDPKLSLEPDPEGELNLTDVQKDFINLYVEHRSMNVCSTALGLSLKDTFDIAKDPTVKEEIKRINLAYYFRSFHRTTLTLDEAGGYLKSLIVDDVPEYQRIKGRDKLKAIELSVKIQEIKAAVVKDPSKMDFIDAETIKEDVKDLNVKDIKRLIEETGKMATDNKKADTKTLSLLEQKNRYISEIAKRNKGEIDITDKAYLRSLPLKELENILIADEEINIKKRRQESLETEERKIQEDEDISSALEKINKQKEESLKAEEDRFNKLKEIKNRGIIPQEEEGKENDNDETILQE